MAAPLVPPSPSGAGAPSGNQWFGGSPRPYGTQAPIQTGPSAQQIISAGGEFKSGLQMGPTGYMEQAGPDTYSWGAFGPQRPAGYQQQAMQGLFGSFGGGSQQPWQQPPQVGFGGTSPYTPPAQVGRGGGASYQTPVQVQYQGGGGA